MTFLLFYAIIIIEREGKSMVKAIKQEDYYNHSCSCDGCGLILLYNNEDVMLNDDIDYIICPVCGERNYL